MKVMSGISSTREKNNSLRNLRFSFSRCCIASNIYWANTMVIWAVDASYIVGTVSSFVQTPKIDIRFC